MTEQDQSPDFSSSKAWQKTPDARCILAVLHNLDGVKGVFRDGPVRREAGIYLGAQDHVLCDRPAAADKIAAVWSVALNGRSLLVDFISAPQMVHFIAVLSWSSSRPPNRPCLGGRRSQPAHYFLPGLQQTGCGTLRHPLFPVTDSWEGSCPQGTLRLSRNSRQHRKRPHVE